MKLWNTVAEMSSPQNSEMVKRLYTSFLARCFIPPSDDGYQACFLNPSASASAVYGRCHDDRLILPQNAPTPFDAIPPRYFWSIHFLFIFLLLPPTPGGFLPLFNLLILAIDQCSYTGNILYYLSDTVTYKTLTSVVWSRHERFAKVYNLTPVEFVICMHKKWALSVNVSPYPYLWTHSPKKIQKVYSTQITNLIIKIEENIFRSNYFKATEW